MTDVTNSKHFAIRDDITCMISIIHNVERLNVQRSKSSIKGILKTVVVSGGMGDIGSGFVFVLQIFSHSSVFVKPFFEQLFN